LSLEEFQNIWKNKSLYSKADCAKLSFIRRRIMNREASNTAREKKKMFEQKSAQLAQQNDSLQKQLNQALYILFLLLFSTFLFRNERRFFENQYKIISSHAHSLYCDAHSKGIIFSSPLEEAHSSLGFDTLRQEDGDELPQLQGTHHLPFLGVFVCFA
jgi:hypothetical protein